MQIIDTILINKIVKRIADTVHPDKIVLLGSHARGAQKQGSDIDLLMLTPPNHGIDGLSHSTGL